MTINVSALNSTLQSKVDALDAATDTKEILLLSKALDAAAGSIAVSDVLAEGVVQVNNVNAKGAEKVAEVNDLATNTFKTVGGSSVLGSGDISVSAGLKSMQVFTSSATWTKPAGINTIKVYVTGGGAGAGSGCSTDNGGGGGGAGGTSIKIIDVSSVSSVAVTIGDGGSGGTSNTTDGNNGGSSSFGTYCSATGGNKGYRCQGTGAFTGSQGGVGTGGSLNLHGGAGQTADGGNSTDQASAPTGGGSYWGGGAMGATRGDHSYNTRAQRHAQVYGSGGGGGTHTTSTSRSYGGNGKHGVVVIEECI